MLKKKSKVQVLGFKILMNPKITSSKEFYQHVS